MAAWKESVLIRRIPWFVLAAALAVLHGCGDSDETPLKIEDDNPFQALAAGTDTTLDIATWNLHGFAGQYGAETIALVKAAVTAIDVDVIGLQEVASASDFDQLVAQLPGWAGYRAPSGGDWSLAYLWRTDTIVAGADAIHEIFPDQGNPFPRAPLVFEFAYAGKSVLMIDNHLKCCGDDHLVMGNSGDEEYRRFLAGNLLEDWIATEAAGRAVVLVGDLNDELPDPVADNVFQMFLDLPASYRFADWDVAVGPHGGWSWGPGESHLDHILVTDELFAALGPCRTLRLDLALAGGVYANKVSDHAPVVLRLDLDAITTTAR
jgi:endonuclease/exonuclease/phosphatase family metal-dependent hydrolase